MRHSWADIPYSSLFLRRARSGITFWIWSEWHQIEQVWMKIEIHHKEVKCSPPTKWSSLTGYTRILTADFKSLIQTPGAHWSTRCSPSVHGSSTLLVFSSQWIHQDDSDCNSPLRSREIYITRWPAHSILLIKWGETCEIIWASQGYRHLICRNKSIIQPVHNLKHNLKHINVIRCTERRLSSCLFLLLKSDTPSYDSISHGIDSMTWMKFPSPLSDALSFPGQRFKDPGEAWKFIEELPSDGASWKPYSRIGMWSFC